MAAVSVKRSIGRHEVLLPINHNFDKICNIIGYFLNQNTRNSKFCFASSEKKKPFKRARDGAYCPIGTLRFNDADGNENVA